MLTTCPRCKGEGAYPETVAWSDGLGITTVTCEVCDRAGEIDFTKAAIERNELERQLRDLARYAELYLAATTTGLPNEKHPNATPYPDVWAGHLARALRKVERRSAPKGAQR